ncbi:glycoside hydrolase family 43 protein [Nocardia wallacei]|uniref:glycoside hydrolase family 43 protein n=1 Tax=Nocardia wallacei TaxID=480035 RepID=UPI0024583D8C|nr:glycoside hydrolase family 43 protein [Nocardia wallacei]
MTFRSIDRRGMLGLAVGLPLSLTLGRGAAAQPAPGLRYTLTGFTNSSESDLFVYESADATRFSLLRARAYTPPTGLMRDPCLLRHVDGAYYITYTTGWEGNTIGFARSTDRATWTHLYDYTVPIDGVTSTWAPEWFVDSRGGVNVIVSLSDGYRFTPHLMTATDAGLRSWTALTPVAGLAPAPDDPDAFGYIDTTIVQVGRRYVAFTKNETTKLIELAVADAVTGPYTFVATGDWAGWGAPREGQSVTALPGGGWRIYFDAYTEGRYLYSDSLDGFRTWTAPTELPGLSGTVRHVTVLREHLAPETPESAGTAH